MAPPLGASGGPRDFAGQGRGTAAAALRRPARVGGGGQHVPGRRGANIVSLDQHSTEQTGGTFMQRTIFHLPGLSAARDALERDFAQRVAARFGMDFASPRPPSRSGSPSWRPGRPLPAGSAVAQPSRRARHVGVDGDRQPSRPRRSGAPVRRALHARARDEGDPRRSRAAPARPAARQRRPGGAGALHADRHPGLPDRGRAAR